MDRGIGVFDSGVGGLTVVKAIKDLLPHEQVIYFGDTARVPYGNKSEGTIRRYARENHKFLKNMGVKVVVVACNSASAAGVDHLREPGLPVLEVISPGTEAALAATKNQTIGVIGTSRTVNSGAYKLAVFRLCPQATVYQIPCPLLVPLIEENWIKHQATNIILEEYLRAFQGKTIDTLILGCTHYPMIKGLVKALLKDVSIVDSAEMLAAKLKALLEEKNMTASLGFSAKTPDKFYVSDTAEKFEDVAALILGRPIHLELVVPNE